MGSCCRCDPPLCRVRSETHDSSSVRLRLASSGTEGERRSAIRQHRRATGSAKGWNEANDECSMPSGSEPPSELHSHSAPSSSVGISALQLFAPARSAHLGCDVPISEMS
eukprot:scaffold6261_cov28-Tisochrysis_lutea.AAC.3